VATRASVGPFLGGDDRDAEPRSHRDEPRHPLDRRVRLGCEKARLGIHDHEHRIVTVEQRHGGHPAVPRWSADG
jgi:hypothetical protein